MSAKIRSIFERWAEFLKVAWDSVRAHRLRSFLTIIGIVIGVAVVALVSALLDGASNFIVSQTANFAPDVVRVDKAAFQDFSGDGQEFVTALSRRPDIYNDELQRLRDRLSETIEVGAQADAGLPVRRGERTLEGVVVQGVTSNITALTTIKVARGREFTPTDDFYRSNVVIIGTDLVDELFPTTDPLGSEIRIGQLPYTVVGVAEPRGSLFGASQDGFALIPLGTFAKIFGGRSRSLSLLARAKPETGMSVTETEDTVRVALRIMRKLESGVADDFSLTTAKSVQAFTETLTGLVATITYPLTMIALVVGGVVVMNMMLASVTERTREIGIRIAIGARRRDILTQFLFEATLLTLIGGLIGLALAYVVVKTAAILTGFPIALPLRAVGAAILLSCLIGIVFGVLPARRASRLDPIEALRSE
ncbi:MAG: ABC transporter permease [Acidobacteria bacterium]|nr:ABC transporter permease [Acidobacteriota bacterium]MBK8811142.1 ABC transporter permease [Acidobacteriota bacterium]